MKKVYALNLKSITYSGASVGDDIRVKIVAGGQLFSLRLKVKHGTKLNVGKEVCLVEVAGSICDVLVETNITEEDALFDDVGNTKETLRFDISRQFRQTIIVKVAVAENRGVRGGNTASFDVEFELARVIRFVENVDTQGWLAVLPSDVQEEVFSLPLGLAVELNGRDGQREYFTIMEGVLKNKNASVSLKKDGSSRFSKTSPWQKSVTLTYSRSHKILKLGSRSYKTEDYSGAPWTNGDYNIEIPDYPHEFGQKYLELAPHATTWFRINHPDGERYLHTGDISAGCMTMSEKKRWEEIYLVLIYARTGDGKSVGILRITN